MTFEEIVDQALDMVRRRGQMSYRMLKRHFALDDETLDDLKEELLYSHPEVVDDQGRGLMWTGEVASLAAPTPVPAVQPAEPETTPSVTSSPDAERRQLTVMFCDLVGSTPLSEQLDPEDLREVVRAYQQTCAEVVQRFDGHVAQLLGDALLVYFGWPQAHEDDAPRAVRTGLGMLEAMGTLNALLERDKGFCLAIRVGIHTGLVVVGDMGGGAHQEQLALGETPNIASRLQGLAEPDTVVISEATYQLIEGYFTCQAFGAHRLKGVVASMPVYRVLESSGAHTRFEVATRRGLTSLVGREDDVALLQRRWTLSRSGQGQGVLLSGEGGIGKSRLVEVLRQQVASEGCPWMVFRCSPYHTNSALYPVIEQVQRWLQFHPDDTPETRLHKLEQVLRSYGFALEEVVPLFAALLAVPMQERYPAPQVTPQRQRQQTLDALVAWLLAEAARQPLLVVWEDLHWADPSTLELLSLLMEQVAMARLLTLLTFRPAFCPPWAMAAQLTQQTLSRLTSEQIERMATHVAGGKSLPDAVIQQVVTQTDGVPLFVEEMTKVVLESGVVKDVNGEYEVTGSLSSLAIPATLQDWLMARLDRLMTAKGIAQLGATIGRQFSYALLHAVSQLDDATLQRELGRLIDAELVYQRGVPPQATYTFKHALITDAAYASLLKRTRQQYHQRIAQVVEEQFSEMIEMQPELLAHHFTEAGQDEDAIRYWQWAGQRATQRSAYVEAIAHLTQGLALLTRLPETSARLQQELDLQVTLGHALGATKGNSAPDTERAYARARELCQQLGDTLQIFPVLQGLILYYQGRGQYQTAYQLGEQLLHLAQSQPESAPLMLAHQSLGMVLFWWGQPTVSHTHHTQVLAIYNRQEHRDLPLRHGSDLGVTAHTYAAVELWQLGYPDQSMQHSQEARMLAREISHPYNPAVALLFAAILHQFRREATAAHEQAEAAMIVATEQGFAERVARAAVLHGWALAMQGQVEAGIAEMRQGLAAFLATGAKMFQPYFLGLLAEAYREGGHPETGLPLLAEAVAMMDATEARFFYGAELYRLKGKLLLSVECGVQSAECIPEACFQQALDIARSQQAKSWELRAATSLARLWQSQDKRQEATDLLAPVYEWFTEGFDTADLQEAQGLLAELAR